MLQNEHVANLRGNGTWVNRGEQRKGRRPARRTLQISNYLKTYASICAVLASVVKAGCKDRSDRNFIAVGTRPDEIGEVGAQDERKKSPFAPLM